MRSSTRERGARRAWWSGAGCEFPRWSRLPLRLRFLLVVLFLVGLSGCAPKQRVPLEVWPQAVRLYLDGEVVDAMPTAVELRADRDHKLFFKGEGYRSELVVLRTGVGPDGRQRLDPPVVRVKLVPIDRSGREVEIEADMPSPSSEQGAQ